MRRPVALRFLAGLCLLLATVTLAACASGPRGGGAEPAVVSGTVVYRPRIALPPDAVVQVALQDVSRAGTPATIAEHRVPTAGRQVPIPFTLQVDRARVAADGRYAVRAEIRGEGTLLWTTNTPVPVTLAAGQPAEVTVVVVQPPVAGEGAGAGALVGPTWRLVRIETGGQVLTPSAQEAYTIAFDTTGRFNGQAHCNRYGGEFRAGPNGALTLSQGLSTLAACPTPSSATAFMGVLGAVAAFGVSGDELRLTTGASGATGAAGARGALVFRRPAGG